MLQIIDNDEVYVVDLKTVPELPITWNTPEEEPYARALQGAIERGQISEPGKYAFRIYEFHRSVEMQYEVARVIE